MVQYFPIVTGSLTVTGSVNVSGSITTNSTITATTLVVQTITSSISAITGSTNFGSLSSNTHTFTGSILVSGSVGIGTSSPSEQLNLMGANAYTSKIRFTNGPSNTGYYTNFGYNSDGNKIYLQMADGAAASTIMTWNYDGKIGIGTSSPSGILQVQGVQDGVSGKNITLSYNGTYYAEYTEKSIRAYNNELIFGTGTSGTERMRINPIGDVGIGVTPATFNTIGPVLQMGRAVFYGYSNEAALGANFRYETGDKYINSDYGCLYQMKNGTHVWSTAPSGTAGTAMTLTARMIISNGGQVLINTASSLYPNVKLCVKQTLGERTMDIWSNWSGDQSTTALSIIKYDNVSTTAQVFQRFVIDNGNIASGQINANGANAVAFGSWSDVRLKENITNLPSQLSNIISLRPVEFDYKDGSGHQIGFIAQEMQEVYPDAIGENEEGFLTITGWSKTEARLVKALQELNTKFEDYKATHP